MIKGYMSFEPKFAGRQTCSDATIIQSCFLRVDMDSFVSHVDLNVCRFDINVCRFDINMCRFDINICRFDINVCHFDI